MEWIPPDIDVLAPPIDCKKITYTISESKFREAYSNGVWDAKTRTRLLLLICAGVTLIGIAVFTVSEFKLALLATSVTAAFAFISVGVSKWEFSKNSRKIYDGLASDLNGPIDLVFGPGFLGTRTPSGLAGTTVLFGVKKLAGFRLIYLAPRVFFIVPLSAFSSDSDIDSFDRIVTELSKNHR